MARRLPREPRVRAAPAGRSLEKAGRRPGSGLGGGRAAAASRDGPSRTVGTSLAGPGDCTCPGARPQPAPGRTGRSGADARGPRRLRPVSPRVSRGGGRSGPGKRQAPARRAAAKPSSPAGAPRLLPSVRSRCATPARPLGSGAPPPRSSPQPTQPRPAARTDADADSPRARAPSPRSPARPVTRLAHRALARAYPVAPRTRIGSAGLAAGLLAGACGGRCGGGLRASILREGFSMTSASPSRVAPWRRWRGLLRRDPVDCADGCCLILHRGKRESRLCLLVLESGLFPLQNPYKSPGEGEPGSWALSHSSVTLNRASDSPLR